MLMEIFIKDDFGDTELSLEQSHNIQYISLRLNEMLDKDDNECRKNIVLSELADIENWDSMEDRYNGLTKMYDDYLVGFCQDELAKKSKGVSKSILSLFTSNELMPLRTAISSLASKDTDKVRGEKYVQKMRDIANKKDLLDAIKKQELEELQLNYQKKLGM
ncbi:hypothetical protein AGMMS50249_1500 [candidate division SR1 bacterium]|nr:hypothetical protein AGMMS50249_1500 [candidate division SR1 bacterium]